MPAVISVPTFGHTIGTVITWSSGNDIPDPCVSPDETVALPEFRFTLTGGQWSLSPDVVLRGSPQLWLSSRLSSSPRKDPPVSLHGAAFGRCSTHGFGISSIVWLVWLVSEAVLVLITDSQSSHPFIFRSFHTKSYFHSILLNSVYLFQK